MGADDAAAQVGLGLSLIKQLGSRKKRFRDKALRLLLRRWLPFQPNLTDVLMKKLWKGFFFCVWHADFQSHGLIHRLASLIPRLHNSSVSLHYFSSFLLTMRRQWPGFDALRFEKLYFFIRRFLHYSFAFLKIHSWDLDLTSRLISVLEDTCFLVKQGNSFGVSYHIASVFLEELRPFLPLRPEVLEVLFKPFISVLEGRLFPDKVLSAKIMSNMFHVLLKMGNKLLLEANKLARDDKNDDAVVVLGTIALTMGFSNKFFELGYSVDCLQGNRKPLFVLYEQFLKLEKDLESSGIQVSILCGIPTLIPVGTDMEVGDLEKPLDKEKKASGGKKGKKKRDGFSDSVLPLSETEFSNIFGQVPERSGRKKGKKKNNVAANADLDKKKKKKKKKDSGSGGKKNGFSDGVLGLSETESSELFGQVADHEHSNVAANAGLDNDLIPIGNHNMEVGGLEKPLETFEKKKKKASGSGGERNGFSDGVLRMSETESESSELFGQVAEHSNVAANAGLDIDMGMELCDLEEMREQFDMGWDDLKMPGERKNNTWPWKSKNFDAVLRLTKTEAAEWSNKPDLSRAQFDGPYIVSVSDYPELFGLIGKRSGGKKDNDLSPIGTNMKVGGKKDNDLIPIGTNMKVGGLEKPLETCDKKKKKASGGSCRSEKKNLNAVEIRGRWRY